MVNQKKKKQVTAASPAINGICNTSNCSTNGHLQKNGVRELDVDGIIDHSGARGNIAVSPTQQMNSENNALRDQQSATAEPTASCSTESQTQCFEYAPDALISFAGSSEWNRVETMCEMVSNLSPFELRLLASCVEGAARPSASSLKHYELRANNTETVTNLLMGGKLTFPHTIEYAFMLISLLRCTNRGTAFAFVRLIDQLMADRVVQLPLLPHAVRINVIQKLGKLVSAALHHPAFSVDQRIRLANNRDDLRHELEQETAYRGGISENKGQQPLMYIKKFKATADPNGNHFMIQLLWNDGLYTWVHRSRAEIAALHHRLLDHFGEERREETSNGTTSTTPTSLCSSWNGSKSSRILTYLNADGSDSEVIEYINGLSDLPARMMLSPVIYEEFYASRQNAGSETKNDRCSQTSSSLPAVVHRVPATAPQTFVVATQPLIYGPNSSNSRLQVNAPSCSNCAGDHSFVQCDKQNIMEVAHQGRDGLHVVANNHNEERNESPTMRLNPQFPPGLAIQAPYQVILADPSQPMFFPPPPGQPMLLPYPMPHPPGQLNNN